MTKRTIVIICALLCTHASQILSMECQGGPSSATDHATSASTIRLSAPLTRESAAQEAHDIATNLEKVLSDGRLILTPSHSGFAPSKNVQDFSKLSESATAFLLTIGAQAAADPQLDGIPAVDRARQLYDQLIDRNTWDEFQDTNYATSARPSFACTADTHRHMAHTLLCAGADSIRIDLSSSCEHYAQNIAADRAKKLLSAVEAAKRLPALDRDFLADERVASAIIRLRDEHEKFLRRQAGAPDDDGNAHAAARLAPHRQTRGWFATHRMWCVGSAAAAVVAILLGAYIKSRNRAQRQRG